MTKSSHLLFAKIVVALCAKVGNVTVAGTRYGHVDTIGGAVVACAAAINTRSGRCKGCLHPQGTGQQGGRANNQKSFHMFPFKKSLRAPIIADIQHNYTNTALLFLKRSSMRQKAPPTALWRNAHRILSGAIVSQFSNTRYTLRCLVTHALFKRSKPSTKSRTEFPCANSLSIPTPPLTTQLR